MTACGWVESKRSSDWSPETCRSWALRFAIFELMLKDGLWPVPGTLEDEFDATLLTFKTTY